MKPEQIAEWNQHVASYGRVEIPSSRLSLLLLLFAAVVFSVIGVVMLVSDDARGTVMLFGILAIVFFGVIGIPALIRQFVRADRPLVIDNVGIQLPGKPMIPWHDVKATGVLSSSGSRSVAIEVSPEFLQQYQVRDHGVMKALTSANTRLTRTTAIYLPNTLRADAKTLAAWIAIMAEEKRSRA